MAETKPILEFATKEDLYLFKIEVIKEIAALRYETKDMKTELLEKMGKVKFSMVIWYIIIATSQTGTILGFLYFMLKK